MNIEKILRQYYIHYKYFQCKSIMVKYWFYLRNICSARPILQKYSLYIRNVCNEMPIL